MEIVAKAAGHADRTIPIKNYCAGLLLPGERKSVEPMAARLAPGNVRRMHQTLHHLVADAPWSDDLVLDQVRDYALSSMRRKGPVTCWVVDDTGFPKKGNHSVGVARQYCGQLGKQENCRVAVSLSLANRQASIPVAFQLYLPESWAAAGERRARAGIPDSMQFQTKPQISLGQIRRTLEAGVPPGVVLADAGYGVDGKFREGITSLGLRYAVGVQSSITVWEPGKEPLPPKPYSGTGRPPKLLRRDPDCRPVSGLHLAQSLPADAWKSVTWREGTKRALRSRFASVRIRPAHRDYWRAEPHPEEWLLVEWPEAEPEPTKFWLSTVPPETELKALVGIAKQRWVIERDYEELKQELGLGHYEGRGWRGFHHHATLCIAACGFLVAERSRFPPSAQIRHVGLRPPELPSGFRPRGSPPPGEA